MTTKHTPATPLPWATRESHVHNGPRKVCTAVEHTNGHDAAYIVRAANAYPKLVEALRTAMESLDDAARAPKVKHDRGAEAVDICALLRELGEAE